MKQKIVVLSGAGVSAQSGIQTFRDAGGLWEGHDVMEVASPQGWRKNQDLVLEFYNLRRAQLKEVKPNEAHIAIANLETEYEVIVVTQNVDDLHERGGSSKIIHLHGELKKVRSVDDESLITETEENIITGDLASDGYQLRPHIVWFGEEVPELERAARELLNANIVIIIGTSMQVYPAASLISYAPSDAKVYYIDPNPKINYELQKTNNLKVIEKTATEGMKELIAELLK